uniref:AlNc14C270G9950 protein n=1 Tax=Albugo laibachii Nc14 TaxID=890382 RepID=F0WUC9_9STRA|nr:AlNc14C270G9950 [Albugo laibachii Nc14]|eukprot:CCA25007.1 AlNc14C270G9950 [Albugo laibachii Nc14]
MRDQLRPGTCPVAASNDELNYTSTRHLRISCSGIAKYDEKADTRKPQWRPRRRRHPLHIAPLIISPITKYIRAEQHPIEFTLPRKSRNDTEDKTEAGDRDNQRWEVGLPNFQQSVASDTICLRTDIGILDIDNQDLDTTLREMDQVLHELQEWKTWRRNTTQAASFDNDDRTTKTQAEREMISLTREEDFLLQCLKEQHRKRQSDHAKLEEMLQTPWKHDHIAISRGDTLVTSSPAQLQQLEAEVFDLDVKKIKSEKIHQVLWDLEGANESLDFQLVDVEAYSSELDHVLAEFDSANSNSS